MGNPQASILRQVIEGHPHISAEGAEGRGAAGHAPGGSGATAKVPAVHAGHMKLLFENAPVAMAMFDQQMRYLLANRRWLEDFKLTQVDVSGRSQYELFPSLHPGWRHVYERALGGQVVRSDRDAVTQDGRPVVYRWEVRPWRHIDTSIGGVMITCEHLYAGPAEEEKEAPEPEDAALGNNALWDSQLPLLAMDDAGRVLRMSHGVARLMLPLGVTCGETPLWEAFGEKMEKGPLQQHVLATLKAVLTGTRAQAVISVYGDEPAPGAGDDGPPDRWLISKAPGGVVDQEGDVVLAVGLAGVESLYSARASVVPPPASVIFGDKPAVRLPVAPEPAPAPPPPVAPVDDAVSRRLAEEVARMREALKEATDSEALSRQREARLRAVLELAPCGLLVLDERARPLYANAHLNFMLGRPLPEGRSMEEWLAEGCRDEEHRDLVLSQWREKVWRKQLTVAMALVSAEGVVKDLEIRPVSLPGGGLLAMLQDVTDTRRCEEMLRSTEAKFRTLVHENPQPVLLADRHGSIFDANPAAEALLGYTRAELRRMRLDQWLDAGSVTRRAVALRDMLEHGERSTWVAVGVVGHDGSPRNVRLRLAVVPDALGQPLFTIHFFQLPAQAEQRGAEPAHPLAPASTPALAPAPPARVAFAPAPPAPVVYRPVVLLTTDVHGRISDWSPEAAEQFGYEETEILGRGLHSLFRPSDATGFYADLAALSDAVGMGGLRWPSYHRDKGRQDGVFKVQRHPQEGGLAVSLLKDLPAREAGLHEAAPRFTAPDPPEASAALTAAAVKVRIPASAFTARPARPDRNELKRERILLGESYRRVKNHLQIITSMLNLQLSTLRNEEARDALRSSQNRVRSLAALHQHLYALASGETGGFQSFAEGLVGHLRECHGVPESRVALDFKVTDDHVPEDWLMPLALSLNEMVANAFQHAYAEGRRGRMTVELRWDDTLAHLIVQDDGAGMPPDFDDYRGNGLGLKILRVFAGQLGGEVKIQGNPGGGAIFHLEFPVADMLDLPVRSQ